MRMFYQPEEQDRFTAGRALLLRRFGAWADGLGISVDLAVAREAWEYRHHGTVDGRLGLWGAAQIRGFLLEWMPLTVPTRPDGPLPDGPGTLRALLRYLDETGLADPRGRNRDENEAALLEGEVEFGAAMADRERWGVRKFWVATATEQGFDVAGSTWGLKDFIDRALRCEVPHDAALLDRIRVRHRALVLANTRALPQVPVVVPGMAELGRHAEGTGVVREFRALAEWAGREGPDGRALSATKRVRLADAQEVADLLGTGDVVNPVRGRRIVRTRSSADLKGLNRAFEWAKTAQVVRTTNRRLRVAVGGGFLLKDGLALWQRAFDTLFELRDPLVGPRSMSSPASMVHSAYEEVLTEVLSALYSLPHPMPWPRLRHETHRFYRTRFGLTEDNQPCHAAWFKHADRDLRTVLDALEHLGCVERAEGPAAPVYLRPGYEELAAGPAELLSLTPLGTWAVRERLLADGCDAPLTGELAEAPAAGFLAVAAEQYDAETARDETEAWIAAHGGAPDAVEQLVDAARAMPFRTRAEAMLELVVRTIGETDGVRLLRGLRSDPGLAPTALGMLLRRDVLGQDDLTADEYLLLTAESLLKSLEIDGPDAAVEALLSAGRREAEEALAAVLESGHPDRAGLDDLRGIAADRLQARAVQLGRLRSVQARQHGGKRAAGRRRHR